MGLRLGDLENLVGILFILAFTAAIAYLTLQQNTAPLSTSTSAASLPSSTSTTSSTTTSRTSTSAASLPSSTSTSSSTTSSSTTTTMFVIQCAADADCGEEHYDGTYICLSDGPTTALQNCTPKCVHGACTEKCRIVAMFDKCNRTQICIPGQRRCVDRNRFKNTTEVEVFYDRYVQYRGYQFRLNYTAYQNGYEVKGIFLDVILPGGGRDDLIAMWDVSSELGDMEVGLYGVKRDSAIIWLQKT